MIHKISALLGMMSLTSVSSSGRNQLIFPKHIYCWEEVVRFTDWSKHKEVNIYAHYAHMLNGKNIVDIIQFLVNIPTAATCALLLHFTINKILLSRRRIFMTRARSKILPSLEMIQLCQRHKELLSKPQSNKLR